MASRAVIARLRALRRKYRLGEFSSKRGRTRGSRRQKRRGGGTTRRRRGSNNKLGWFNGTW